MRAESKLEQGKYELLNKEDIIFYLNAQGRDKELLYELANEKKRKRMDNTVYVRGVIELSNLCKNECKYCSMSVRNYNIQRYQLTYEQIINSIHIGYDMGIRTFHLSSGENDCYYPEKLSFIIEYIKKMECKVILVLGKKKFADLQMFKRAGADIYISKFETSNDWLYYEHNNKNGGLDFRLEYLQKLRRVGFKIGTGNIIGLPFQNDYSIVEDLLLMKRIKPDQASTSRFIPNQYSQYRRYPAGNVNKTTNFIALMRLVLDDSVLIPTNSSIGIDERFNALLYGANLISINLTPEEEYKKYVIYDEEKRIRARLDDYKIRLEERGMKIISGAID